ncbi:MAG: hypothetical protein AVDCRST_MAG88-1878, partial [uncultured Thermomicrobiales bacterium]
VARQHPLVSRRGHRRAVAHRPGRQYRRESHPPAAARRAGRPRLQLHHRSSRRL